jgi:prevent-host-death family protein
MSTSKSVSYVKAHLAEVIHEVNANRRPVVVTQNGASTVVIQDHDTYQRTRDALLLLKLVAMGEADVAKGRTIPQDQVFSSLKARLKERIATGSRAEPSAQAEKTGRAKKSENPGKTGK